MFNFSSGLILDERLVGEGIPTNLFDFWFDAENVTQAGNVSELINLSSDNNAAQADNSKKPAYNSIDSDYNGLPSLGLVTSSIMNLQNPLEVNDRSTFFFVCKALNPTSSILPVNGASLSGAQLLHGPDRGILRSTLGNEYSANIGSLDTAQIVTLNCNGSDLTVYFNGVNVGTVGLAGTWSNFDFTQLFQRSDGFGSHGTLYQMSGKTIGNLSTSQINQVGRYLSSKLGYTWTDLP